MSRSKLLNILKLNSDTGEAMANTVIESVSDWGGSVTEGIQSLLFNTTTSNTGHINVVCKLIKDKIGRKLLNLACRQHILKKILEVFFATYVKTVIQLDQT